ncbi:MAG: hypothetical protein Q7K47_02300 [Fusobacterium sp. JB019]|nr:hypothetical protein [Fusobacterium sp. JB019]
MHTQLQLNDLDKVVVKLEVDKKREGSGVICYNSEERKYFILTAKHVLLGDKYEEIFNEIIIKPLGIKINPSQVIYDKDDAELDLVIIFLEIENQEIPIFEYLEITQTEEKVFFKGYPKSLGGQAIKINCNYGDDNRLEPTTNIESIEKSIIDNCSGLSGSGLFLKKYEKIFLVGVIYEVIKGFNQFKVYNLNDINSILIKNNLNVFKFSENKENKKIIERFERLNEEYISDFTCLKDGFIKREETQKCIEEIEKENSIIIHGRAGFGKSGCTYEIIDYCEKKEIPYVAIKLDKYIPKKNIFYWGEELSLEGPISYCADKIMKDKKGIVILDQLDAFRWTKANSSESLRVCKEFIIELNNINKKREHKIILIFVCRTYDLEKDTGINKLFNLNDNCWKKIEIKELKEEILKNIMGTSSYNKLSLKTKKVLSIPSNLYIWQQFDLKKENTDYSTTSKLMYGWFEEIIKKGSSCQIGEELIRGEIKKISEKFDEKGYSEISKRRLDTNQSVLNLLVSNGMLVVSKNDKISFVHQSILDYFIYKNMLDDYDNGIDIENIIGGKTRQTPNRRYQMQMLLQNILEDNQREFLEIGKKMLESESIRFYIKFLFYELLNQIKNPNYIIEKYILENCENKSIENYILKDVISGNKKYINVLIKNKILDKWIGDSSKKETVFKLLYSISRDYDEEYIDFISKHAFENKEDSKEFYRCLSPYPSEDTDKMFELREKFYEYDSDFLKIVYIDKGLFFKKEERAIKILSYWMNCKVNLGSEYRYEDKCLDSLENIEIKDGKFVLEKLVKYIPKENAFFEWRNRHNRKNINRICVEIIKKANISLIKSSPKYFFEYYQEYLGKNYNIFNEIILHGLFYIPENFSDKVVEIIINNFNSDFIVDETSGNSDTLRLIKRVISKYSEYCSDLNFKKLETMIIKYIDRFDIEIYKRKTKEKKNKKELTGWNFWGLLQKELLPHLSYKRLSNEGKALIKVLNRKYPERISSYYREDGGFTAIKSSLSGKALSAKRWLKIIKSQKIKEKSRYRIRERKDFFIDNSIEQIASDFTEAVKKDSKKIIEMVLKSKEEIDDVFIDSLFYGVAFSSELENLSKEILEELMIKFPCNMESGRARNFLTIIQKKKEIIWSNKVIEQIKNIAINHKDPEFGKINVTTSDDKDMSSCNMILDNSRNCCRGEAAITIGVLLWGNKVLYEVFKSTIEKLLEDKNIEVKYATMESLFPVCNIDKEWAYDKFVLLFKEDIRYASFRESRKLFFNMYNNYKERITEIISKCYNSKDEDLLRIGSYSVIEMSLCEEKFSEIFNESLKDMSEKQSDYILEMAANYFDKKEYKKKIKEIVYNFLELGKDINKFLHKIFLNGVVDLEEDSKFIIRLFKTKLDYRTIYLFVEYLKNTLKSILEFSNIILELCRDKVMKKDDDYMMNNEISNLVARLYDESKGTREEIACKCMELWDIMFKNQFGSTRIISKKLMER